MSLQSDWSFSARFIPTIKDIIGKFLLVPAPLELDMKEATDLVILRARDMRIACRVRRPGYWPKFSGEFTIRSHRDSGAKTELAKIEEGWGDWLFYAHAMNHRTVGLREWWLLDLDVFRRNPSDGQRKDNEDGTAFRAYKVSGFPPDLIIGSSMLIPSVPCLCPSLYERRRIDRWYTKANGGPEPSRAEQTSIGGNA